MNRLIPILVLFALHTQAQVRLPANELGQVQYQEIVRLSDTQRPARQLISQTKQWVREYYADSNAVEQQYDQEHNILFIKYGFRIDNQAIRYTIILEGKTGRYRVTLTDMITESNGMALPIRPVSPTAAELNQVADGTIRNSKVIAEAVQQQTNLYQRIDKICRDTLASLNRFLKTPIGNSR